MPDPTRFFRWLSSRGDASGRAGGSGRPSPATEGVRTIVYGAGEAGQAVVRLADRDADVNLEIVGFIDDDPLKAGSQVLNRPIYGDLSALPRAVREGGAEQLLIAIAMPSSNTVRDAFEAGRAERIRVRIVPNLRPLRAEDLRPAMIRPLQLQDLLPRRPVEIDVETTSAYLSGASVLVTGGAGSIGSELSRQILALRPRRLTVLDQHEEGLWAADDELRQLRSSEVEVVVENRLADVRSTEAISLSLRRATPNVVFHAAALKHVPIVEEHPSEGVLTNVIGTRNVLRACEAAAVDRFVLISTDKAVDPVGVMGATKRIAELLTLATARRTGRPYVAVRFGNVLGSSGSVIRTFQQQLDRGEPLTITDPQASRYFMTIGEAVALILEAGATAQGGEVYILDMGEPVLIVDLARDLIRLYGLDPESVPIRYTGLRAGERLQETLFYDHEAFFQTDHPGIFRVPAAEETVIDGLDDLVDRLEVAARARDDTSVRDLLAISIVGLNASGTDPHQTTAAHVGSSGSAS